MRILEMSQTQIENMIFKGASCDELRSPLDCFTEEELCVLPRHPQWNSFDLRFRNWMWQTIDGILSYTEPYKPPPCSIDSSTP